MENSKKKYKNHELLNTFGDRLKQLRTSLKLNQSEFGNNLKRKVPSSSISNYETGDTTPQLDFVYDVAETYNISIDWLCGRTEEKSVSFKGIESIEFKTYADLIKVIEKMNGVKIIEHCLHGFGNKSEYFRKIYVLSFEDEFMQTCLEKYKKTKELKKELGLDDNDISYILNGKLENEWNSEFDPEYRKYFKTETNNEWQDDPDFIKFEDYSVNVVNYDELEEEMLGDSSYEFY